MICRSIPRASQDLYRVGHKIDFNLGQHGLKNGLKKILLVKFKVLRTRPRGIQKFSPLLHLAEEDFLAGERIALVISKEDLLIVLNCFLQTQDDFII